MSPGVLRFVKHGRTSQNTRCDFEDKTVNTWHPR